MCLDIPGRTRAAKQNLLLGEVPAPPRLPNKRRTDPRLPPLLKHAVPAPLPLLFFIYISR